MARNVLGFRTSQTVIYLYFDRFDIGQDMAVSPKPLCFLIPQFKTLVLTKLLRRILLSEEWIFEVKFCDEEWSGDYNVYREIMHAMWKPQKFKYTYLFATFYVFTLTIPSASAVYWAFGDQLLNHSNAFSLLPQTRFRDAAVILMLIHQVLPLSSIDKLYYLLVGCASNLG